MRAGEGRGVCVGLDQSGGNYKDCGKSSLLLTALKAL